MGPIPDGYEINHKNGNKLCNVPNNLEVVTRRENQQHAIKTGLHKPRAKKHKHGNFCSKLSKSTAEEIRSEYATGSVTQQALAERHSVTQSHISRIVSGARGLYTWDE